MALMIAYANIMNVYSYYKNLWVNKENIKNERGKWGRKKKGRET